MRPQRTTGEPGRSSDSKTGATAMANTTPAPLIAAATAMIVPAAWVARVPTPLDARVHGRVQTRCRSIAGLNHYAACSTQNAATARRRATLAIPDTPSRKRALLQTSEDAGSPATTVTAISPAPPGLPLRGVDEVVHRSAAGIPPTDTDRGGGRGHVDQLQHRDRHGR